MDLERMFRISLLTVMAFAMCGVGMELVVVSPNGKGHWIPKGVARESCGRTSCVATKSPAQW